MKHSTFQKVIFTTLAMVTSLALSARAGTPSLSSARQAGSAKSINPFHQVLFPASTYMVDDGTAEDAVGLTLGGDVIALNKFAVIPGSEQINSVSIAWGTPVFNDPSLNGKPYTVVVWSDPNNDGNPSDAVVQATASGVVASQGTNTFLTTNIGPVTITTANFFVGFLISHDGGQFPAAFDETNPTFSNVSYIAGDGTQGGGDIFNLLNNDLPVAAIESYGLIGNFLIRADASGGGGGDLVLESSASRKTHGRFGDFDTPLPGVEDRTGATRYWVVMSFNNNVTGADSATTTCGTIGSVSVDAGNSHNLLVSFNGAACNAQNVTVTANNVHDDLGNTLASAAATVGILVGDVNGDGRVLNGDIGNIQGHLGETTTADNFRDDINADGRINNQDVQAARSHRGQSLP